MVAWLKKDMLQPRKETATVFDELTEQDVREFLRSSSLFLILMNQLSLAVGWPMILNHPIGGKFVLMFLL